MSVYLGTVSTVDADSRTVQVLVQPMGLLSGPLRVASPFGLVAPLPAVGDEVLVLAPLGHLSDAVCAGWVPTASDVAAAADRGVVVSTTGAVPTQSDPNQPIGDAAVSGVLAR